LTVEKVLVSWSGGKDCSLVLYRILQGKTYEVLGLLTTVSENSNRVSMHGVCSSLLEQQAQSLELNLEKVFIPKNFSQKEYEKRMLNMLTKYQKIDVSSIVIGDIYLEDVRKSREENLSKIGMKGVFPLWKEDTKKLAREFIDLGFKAIVTCVDSRLISKKFVGREFDKQFLKELPSNTDPSGENGEFHTFVFDGPIFEEKIRFVRGEIVLRNSLCFCDLLPI